MIEKQMLSDSDIIRCLHADYGIEVATLTCLPLGADMDAAVYKAQDRGQRSYFVKVKLQTSYDIGAAVVELLHDAGVLQVIPPIKTIEGLSALHVEDCTISVYPFIEGQDGFSRDLSDAQWSALGKALRQIHEIAVPLAMQNRIRQEEYSPKWRQAVRSLYSHIEAEPFGDEIARKLQKFMKGAMPAIRRLVDSAESLGQMLKGQRHTNVLCHSDLHGGNVLIARDDRVYIVDWDDPIMAPKERDLMFIGAGVANVWNKPHEEELFYKGYKKTEVNRDLMAYYRHERIVQDIAEYGNALLLTMAGGQERQVMYKQFIDMFAARGVVAIAFETWGAIQ